jgi:hypothetical protein
MGAKPRFPGGGGAVGQDVDALAGLGVDERGGVPAASAQGEVVHPQHPGHPRLRQGQVQQDAQGGMPGQAHGHG